MPERSPLPLRAHWPAAALALVAAIVSLWAQHDIFPALSWNRDEAVYLWQVESLRAGHLTSSDGGHPTLFYPFLSGHADGAFFTQYTLGWPLVLLAAEVVTGWVGSALLLGTAVAVVGTYALVMELFADRAVAAVAGAVMIASPILAIQGGVHLGYLFTLGLGTAFGACLLSGIRRRRTGRIVVAGLLVGWIFMTRPYDAILWTLAFVGHAAVVHRAEWRRLVRPIAITAAAAVPLFVATLAYNRRITGDWLGFPITTKDPLDTFGFGDRRLMPRFFVNDFGPRAAVRATTKNLFFLPWFLAGTYVGVVVAAAGLWIRRRSTGVLALVLVGALFPAGYFVFWGIHQMSMFARVSGPVYYIPLYVPLSALIALVLVGLWRRRPPAAVLLGVVLLAATVPASLNRFELNRTLSEGQEAWRSSVAGIEGPALVLIMDTDYLLWSNPFSRNSPTLDDRILYAVAEDPGALDLIAEHPDRRAFLQQPSVPAPVLGPREDPEDLEVQLVPVEVARGEQLVLEVTVTPPVSDDPAVLSLDAEGQAVVRSVPSGRTSVVRLTLGAGGDTALAQRHGTVTLTLSTSTAGSYAPRVSQEIVYRVQGSRIEALLPAARLRNVGVGEIVWEHQLDLPELRLGLRAQGG